MRLSARTLGVSLEIMRYLQSKTQKPSGLEPRKSRKNSQRVSLLATSKNARESFARENLARESIARDILTPVEEHPVVVSPIKPIPLRAGSDQRSSGSPGRSIQLKKMLGLISGKTKAQKTSLPFNLQKNSSQQSQLTNKDLSFAVDLLTGTQTVQDEFSAERAPPTKRDPEQQRKSLIRRVFQKNFDNSSMSVLHRYVDRSMTNRGNNTSKDQIQGVSHFLAESKSKIDQSAIMPSLPSIKRFASELYSPLSASKIPFVNESSAAAGKENNLPPIVCLTRTHETSPSKSSNTNHHIRNRLAYKKITNRHKVISSSADLKPMSYPHLSELYRNFKKKRGSRVFLVE